MHSAVRSQSYAFTTKARRTRKFAPTSFLPRMRGIKEGKLRALHGDREFQWLDM
jgi:hypothetical protein